MINSAAKHITKILRILDVNQLNQDHFKLCTALSVVMSRLYWKSVIDFYHGVHVVSIANCISGLYSPGLCSVISLFSWWNLWMKSCSYGISSRVSLIGLTSFIISSIVPYSCLLCRMCCAKADCGLLFLIYRTCSWNLLFRSRLVCPMYLWLYVLQVNA